MREADQVLFVLRRNVAGGDVIEAVSGECDQDYIDENIARFVIEYSDDTVGIGRRSALEHAVEPVKEPAEGFVHPAGERVFRLVVAFEQQRGHGGGKRQRVECRNDRRYGDGKCELAVELPRQTADERDGDEHGAQRERDGDNRARNFAHGLIGRLLWR